MRRVVVYLEVLRLEAPRGSFGEQSGLWRLLDELPAPATTTVNLRENGFRYGVGSAEAGQLVRQCLESVPGLRVARDRVMPDAARPVEIEVTDTPRDVAAFGYDRGGRMRGMTFDVARPFFQVRMQVATTMAGGMQLRVTPELREPPGPSTYVKRPEGYRQEPTYRGRVFDELALTARLEAGAFVVIGASAEVWATPLVGTPFFVTADPMQQRESLYVLIPQMDAGSGWWRSGATAVGSR